MGKTSREDNFNSFTDEYEVKYTRKDLDIDAGLCYFNARWYFGLTLLVIPPKRELLYPNIYFALDARLGRFITEDPARDGLNWYSYVGNNPMGFVDPTGLWTFEVQLAFGPGIKVKFGKNDGVSTFGFDVGLGIAAGFSLDRSTTEIDDSDLGTNLSVKIEGKMEVGEASLDSKCEATLKDDLSIENTSEANFSYTDPMTRIEGGITIDTEGVESSYDIDTSIDGGLGGGVFVGAGIETNIEVDE